MSKTQLVLDVGGVLGTNLTRFWHELAASASLSYEDLRRLYKQELRDKCWTGEISEPDFFTWACSIQSSMNESQARSLMLSCLQPLPAYKLVPDWSKIYDLHILSNHRSEWLAPFLAPILPYFQTVTISSEIGCAKPSPDIFKHAASVLPKGATVLFVDDTEHNLTAAADHGWQILLADSEGHWIHQIAATNQRFPLTSPNE
ncbi:HAD-IA family hydrolase [Paenibacillus filicis]|uniref:HAD-IA family hydrolase n=1 Tax=Paenibacillus gyeongsangnamensis TaxID=3388067 RepID=A0ABT4QF48_9BACL|nr:HAD-IA family hydrolase [Paenibacillus filicis]MCZ8515376.1 HAD-IA family hydrolase [Paenibacillus filicis]